MRLSVFLALLLTAASAQAQPTFNRWFSPNAIGPGSQTTLTKKQLVRQPDQTRCKGQYHQYQGKIDIHPGGLLFIHFQYGKKRFLRHLDITQLLHTLFTFFLLLQQFLLPADVTTVALGGYVLA